MENHIFLMGKLTISMAIFNSYVKLPEAISRFVAISGYLQINIPWNFGLTSRF